MVSWPKWPLSLRGLFRCCLFLDRLMTPNLSLPRRSTGVHAAKVMRIVLSTPSLNEKAHCWSFQDVSSPYCCSPVALPKTFWWKVVCTNLLKAQTGKKQLAHPTMPPCHRTKLKHNIKKHEPRSAIETLSAMLPTIQVPTGCPLGIHWGPHLNVGEFSSMSFGFAWLNFQGLHLMKRGTSQV